MEANLKNFLSVFAISASVLTVSHSIAAQVPNIPRVGEVSVESITTAKQELSKATAISHAALKAKVKSLLGSSGAEIIAVALSELGISPAVALQTMVEAGVPVADAVGFLVVANTEHAPAIVAAALKIHPEAEVAILQAAINAGASPDGLLPATAAGGGEDRSRSDRVAEFRRNDGEHGGGGGVITPPKPVSPN